MLNDQSSSGKRRKAADDSSYWPKTRVTLVARLQTEPAGKCWGEFVELYGPLIHRFCARRLTSEEADDVTQAVFIRVFRHLPAFRYDPAKGRFGGWVGRITRNELLRYVLKWHRDEKRGFDLTRVMAITTRGAWEDEYNLWLIQTALDQVQNLVSAEQFRLFEATWCGQKPGKIAAELGISAARVHKARFIVGEKLRDIIDELCADHPFSEPNRGE